MADRAPIAPAPMPAAQGETVAGKPRPAIPTPTDSQASAWPLSPAGLRRRILVQLRLDGPSSPDDLAGKLGASRTGILQQLRSLEAAELVTRTTERHGVGRPRHRYEVTTAAQVLFPAAYDALADGLLAAVADVGGRDLLADVVEARRRRQAEAVRARLAERLPRGGDLLDRVRELAAIQDEQGYLAEAVLGTDGVIRLSERNCAIHRVAGEHPEVCGSELALFAEVLGAEVSRESHIASGDRCCTYRIEERRPD